MFQQLLPKLIDRYFIKQPRLRRFITSIRYGVRDTSCELLGASFTINSLQENGYLRASQMAVYSSLFRDEVPVLITLASLIRHNQTFIDIGANIGIYSIVLSKFKRLITDFEVIAFEVNPETYKRLANNAKLHGFIAHNLGIGQIQESAEFVKGAVSHVTTRSSLSTAYNINEEKFFAKIKPLMDFAIKGDIILKIDIEGQELSVLEGAKAYFENDQVRCVYLDGYADEGCWEFLERYGFLLLDAKNLDKASNKTFSLLGIKNLAI